ncbi:kinase-like domain-containing protein [Spinellus fusiger]|nr:kinase-like domain-containing protein [Spinellus fusiger]
MSVLSQLKNLFCAAPKRNTSQVQEQTQAQTQMQAQAQEQAQRQEHAYSVESTSVYTDSFDAPTYRGLEEYTLIEKLGEGAFSNVFKAVVIKTHQTVAIKAVRKFELSQAQKASVLKEAQIMRTMSHPSIVKMHHFIETNEHYFLILENCEGGELFHRIVRMVYFSEDLSRHCIEQIASGIHYLHEEKGVVHRDIKPENILFDPIPLMYRLPEDTPPIPQFEGDDPKEDEGRYVPGVGGGGIGRVKIADFGLSKVVWDQQTMTPCGTVGYTAPEIVRDERYSKSVDIWALGCVLYTMLCGFPPFYDDNLEILTEKVARGQYTFLSPWWDTISDEAKDLVSHSLCVDPIKRYTIDQFMQHPWITSSLDKDSKKTVKRQSSSVPCSPEFIIASVSEEGGDPIAMLGPHPMAIPQENIHTTNRRSLFGNDLAAMKESVDLSYAIQRITDERAQVKELRRKPQSGILHLPHRILQIPQSRNKGNKSVRHDKPITATTPVTVTAKMLIKTSHRAGKSNSGSSSSSNNSNISHTNNNNNSNSSSSSNSSNNSNDHHNSPSSSSHRHKSVEAAALELLDKNKGSLFKVEQNRMEKTRHSMQNLCLSPVNTLQTLAEPKHPRHPMNRLENEQVFHLDMDKTTLLGRRKQRCMNPQITLARAFAEDTA